MFVPVGIFFTHLDYRNLWEFEDWVFFISMSFRCNWIYCSRVLSPVRPHGVNVRDINYVVLAIRSSQIRNIWTTNAIPDKYNLPFLKIASAQYALTINWGNIVAAEVSFVSCFWSKVIIC